MGYKDDGGEVRHSSSLSKMVVQLTINCSGGGVGALLVLLITIYSLQMMTTSIFFYESRHLEVSCGTDQMILNAGRMTQGSSMTWPGRLLGRLALLEILQSSHQLLSISRSGSRPVLRPTRSQLRSSRACGKY